MVCFLRMSARFLVALLLVPSVSLAVDFSDGGYSGRVSTTHYGDYVYFDGRLDFGPACSAVQIVAQLADDEGRLIGSEAQVNGWSGGGSKLVESRHHRVGSRKTGWRVLWVKASCVRP